MFYVKIRKLLLSYDLQLNFSPNVTLISFKNYLFYYPAKSKIKFGKLKKT